jgi:hypothetical protein
LRAIFSPEGVGFGVGSQNETKDRPGLSGKNERHRLENLSHTSLMEFFFFFLGLGLGIDEVVEVRSELGG